MQELITGSVIPIDVNVAFLSLSKEIELLIKATDAIDATTVPTIKINIKLIIILFF